MQPQLIPLERFVAVNPGGNPFGRQLAPQRPGYLIFLCVFSLLLGCTGVLRGGCAVLARPQFGYRPQLPVRQVNSVELAAARARAIDGSYNPTNRLLFGTQAVIGLVMAIGAALVLLSRRPGDLLLRGTYVATLVVGAIQILPFALHMLQYTTLSSEIARQASSAPPAEVAGMNQLAMMLRGTAIFGIVFAIAWLILKVALLGHGFRYLGKPDVQACLR